MTDTQEAAQPLKVLIGMPCGDMQFSMTSICYGALISTARGWGVQAEPAINSGSMPQNNRSNLARRAIEMNCDALLLVDPDMTFPPNALIGAGRNGEKLGLLAHGDLDVIGATYMQRCEGGDTHGFEISQHGLGNGQRIDVTAGGPPREVASIPCGFMLIRRRVLDAIVAAGDEPFFRFPWEDGAHQSMSEDYDFCRRVRAMGFRVHVDPELSLALGHIGIKIYTITRSAGIG